MGQLDKRETFLALLQDGWVSICLDARAQGVDLPGHLRSEPRLILQYGLNMPVPIADLQVDGDGIRATLSFNRTPHATFIPWPAVYVIMPTDSDRPGVLFAEDVPPEMQAALRPAPDGTPTPGARAGRRSVGGRAGRRKKATGTTDPVADDGSNASNNVTPSRRHLSLVPEGAPGEPAAVTETPAPRTTRKRTGKPRLRLVK